MANEGEAVIRLDADVSAYVRKMVMAHRSTDEAAKKSVDTIGSSLKQVGATVAAVIGAAAAAADSKLKELAQNNRVAGAAAFGVAQSAARVGGAGSEWARDWVNKTMNGASTMQGRAGLLSSLAGIQESRRAAMQPEIGFNELQQIMAAYSDGGDVAWGENGADITNILGQPGYTGHNFDLLAQMRLRRRFGLRGKYVPGNLRALTGMALDQASPEQIAEMELRRQEAENAQRAQEESRKYGAGERSLQSMLDLGRAQHPWLTAPEKLPVIGWVETQGMEWGGRAAQAAPDVWSMIGGFLKRIAITNEHMVVQQHRPLPNMQSRSNDRGNAP